MERKTLWEKFEAQYKDQLDEYLKETKRMFTSYDRYYEAEIIHKHIDGKRVVNIVDYGCGPGDYGIYLLKKAIDREIRFYDYPSVLKFVEFRLQRGNLNAKTYKVSGIANNFLFNNCDLAIFGEVLEHLKNPLKVLKQCKKKDVRFIWTSSYPYRYSEDYWEDSDHLKEAKDQMMDCRKFLETNYNYNKVDGELRLWTLKQS